MMFPVLLKTAPEVGSKESLYYLVASNGVFRVVDTDIYRAVTKVDGEIPGLLSEAESLSLRFPPVPSTVLGPILAFLRGVFEEHGGEGIVFLFYRPDTRTFRVGVPGQTIPGYRRWDGSWRAYLGLQYGHVQHPPGYLRLGTIHSHASGDARASHIDCEDERFQDGMHLVYGHIDRSAPSRAASIVANGTRFELEPEDVVEWCPVPTTPANPDWMARVERVETGIVPGPSGAFGSVSRAGEGWDDR